MTRVVAAVRVRMGSSRLPGKTLMEVAGRPLLGHLLDRLALCRRLDAVVVATSTAALDDSIEAYCRARGTPCFRGSEDDVLGRMLAALESRRATVGVEVFGDCPLLDPAIVDQLIETYLANQDRYDLVTNDLATTFPPGMEAVVFSMAALRDADRHAGPEAREHGSAPIRRDPVRYRLLNVEAPPELRRPELEIEVDEAKDLEVIAAIVDHFRGRVDVSLAEIIAFLDSRPDVAGVNQDIHRRWRAFRHDHQG